MLRTWSLAMDKHRVHLLPLIKRVATHENIWLLRLKRPGCQPFKLEMVGSIPPGAIQFIGSGSLAIWEEDKATL